MKNSARISGLCRLAQSHKATLCCGKDAILNWTCALSPLSLVTLEGGVAREFPLSAGGVQGVCVCVCACLTGEQVGPLDWFAAATGGH